MHPCTRKQQRRHDLALAICMAKPDGNNASCSAPTRMSLAAKTARLAAGTAAGIPGKPLLRTASKPVHLGLLIEPRRA
jgi:hypothetical protein